MICPHCSGGLVSGWAPKPGEMLAPRRYLILVFPIVLFMRWTFPRLACHDCRVPIRIRDLEPVYRRSARIKQGIGILLGLGVLALFLWPVVALLTVKPR